MHRFRKFLRLPNSERWLLVKVSFLMGVVQAALWLLPFRVVYRFVMRGSRPGKRGGRRNTLDADLICNAVNKSGRHFLGEDSCFPQALVGGILLERSGYDADIHIGVIKNSDGSLKAHAWVERDGVVVIGGPVSSVEKYIPLSKFGRVNS